MPETPDEEEPMYARRAVPATPGVRTNRTVTVTDSAKEAKTEPLRHSEVSGCSGRLSGSVGQLLHSNQAHSYRNVLPAS
jgi:hypothetical protein